MCSSDLRNQFYQGVVIGFSEKLGLNKASSRPNPEKNTTNTQLILAEDKRLNTYVASRNPKLSASYYSRQKQDQESFGAGRRRGQELNLHQGVHHHEKSKKYITAAK